MKTSELKTRTLGLFGLILGMSLLLCRVGDAEAQTLRVLVANDDGIGATGTNGGIDVLVDELRSNPNLIVRVVAPDVNKSGSGDSKTEPPNTITVTPGSTAGTATEPDDKAVDGFPADCVLYGVLGLGFAPDLVVTGINGGQNLGREIGASISGTVGAALTAGRMGIPAIAVSQQRNGTDYTAAAKYVANLVETFRTKKSFAKKLVNKNGLGQAAILNVNVPTCTTGSIRGVALVPLAQLLTFTGYVEQVTPGVFLPTWINNGAAAIIGEADCTSTVEDPTNDLDAFLNGYISLTVLNPDKTVDNKLKRFKSLTKVPFQ
ncbi:MAG: hypothetical protein E4H03_03070 [Myxococcales bacterium]|jgi:5'-nucleotidase|nr:MAG: hypothetical protein E4H03_03070 [Myxococcales bacterium]